MSRCTSMLFLGVAFSLFAAAPALAQMELQGRSQYGGLIRNVNSGKCVDVYGDSTNRGANVQQYACNGGGNQRWEFIALGGGQFAIRNVNSGMSGRERKQPGGWRKRATVPLERRRESEMARTRTQQQF
jgi:hypothetical protein